MSPVATDPELADFEVFQPGRDDHTGNRILRSCGGEPRVILKIYRRRHNLIREVFRMMARPVERRSGPSARARRETERRSIEVWSEAGFRVPRIIDRPIPASVREPALWLEWCEGISLDEYICDVARPTADKLDMIRRLGADIGHRHRIAVDRDEILLVHEHPSPLHLLVTPDEPRPLHLDFENAFAPSYGVLAALTEEIAGHLRRIANLTCEECVSEEMIRSFAAGYDDEALLRAATSMALDRRGFFRSAVRWSDRRRRGKDGKTAIMTQLRSVVFGT